MKAYVERRQVWWLALVAIITLLVSLLLAAGTVQAAGAAPLAGSIGDFVWHDQDLDGLEDPGEPGIDGVVVELLDGSSNVLQSALTAGGGMYSFGGLQAGSYQIRIAASNFAPGGTLYQYGLTSAAFYGPNPYPVTLGANQDFDLADFGYAKSSLELTKTVSLNGQCPGQANATVLPGTQVTYCYEFTNTGDTYFPGTGFPIPPLTVQDSVLGTVCNWSEPAGGDGLLGPGETGQCQSNPVTLQQSVCNVGTVIGTPSDSKPNALSGFATTIANSEEVCVDVVKARLTLTPSKDANRVGDPHVFTAHLEFDYGDGNGWVDAPAGETINFSKSGPGSLSSSSCTTDSNGTCQVTLTSNTTGVSLVTASWSGTITTAHGSTAASATSSTARKRWVDARLTLTPDKAANQVGDPHTLTAHLEFDYGDGNGWVDAPAGETINFSKSGPGSLSANSCTTDANGQCTVTLTSNTTGLTTVTASWNGTIATSDGNVSADASDDAKKRWVDARLTLTPSQAANQVGDPHVFTAHLEFDYGDGNGWVDAPNGETINFSKSGVGSLSSSTCTTAGGNGQCTVTLTSNTTGLTTVTASWNGSISTAQGSASADATSSTAKKRWVDARLTLTPDKDANQVGDPHVFTAHLEFDYGDGNGWVDAPNGETINFSKSGPGSLSSSTCTTAGGNGQCTVTLTSNTTGLTTVTASWNGMIATAEGNASADASDNAKKRWVDARLTLTPPQAYNEIGDDHLFTAHLEFDYGDGNGWVDAPNGETINFSKSGPGTLSSSTCMTAGGNGQCTVTLTSNTTGLTTVTASWNGTIATAQGNASADTSDDAEKRWVDARIKLSPLTATNDVRDPHTFTVLVEQNDSTGWSNAPDGTQVDFTLLNNSANAYFVGGVDSCTTTSGTCTVTINSNQAGSVQVHAETTFVVQGVTLFRETDGLGGNTDDATKTYVAAKIGNYVWEDMNGDGLQNDGNTGINGVTVELYTSGGTLFDTQVTANDGSGNPGYYLFENVVPGSYYVKFIKPSGMVFTVQGPTGSKDPDDSDPDPNNGKTETFSVAANETDLSWDAGLYQPVCVGDYTWIDTNGDGIQDPAELPLSGVVIEVRDSSNVLMDTLTTGPTGGFAPGEYKLCDLPPGQYTSTVVQVPPGFVLATPGQNPTLTSAVLQSGQEDLTLDFPFINTTGVSLMALTASRQNGATTVAWTTIEESGNDGFYVLRSTRSDGVYERISGLVASKAPAGSGASYSFVDSSVEAGTTYWYQVETAPDGTRFGPVSDNGGQSIRRLFMPVVVR